MGDGPGSRQNDQPQGNGIDFNAVISGGVGRGNDAAPRPQDAQRQAPPEAQAWRVGSDATNTTIIQNKTLELSYKDPHFDDKLVFAAAHAPDKFEKIKIDDLPPNYVIHTWLDKNGYFFWYDDGTQGAKAHHYLPNNAMGMEANTARIDLDDERIKDNQAFAKAYGGGGFRNFDRSFVPSTDGTTTSTSYYWQLANAPAAVLDLQANALRESVRNSDNPYFKIYLSDIEAAQALKPLKDGTTNIPNNEYTRKKIDDALSLASAAYTQTTGELGRYNQFPAQNVYLPLAPQRPFWDHNGHADDWMGFWGGGFSQSYGRKQNLTSLRGLIISNVVPRVRQLPPA